MKEKKKTVTSWYIEPLDSYTNRVFSDSLPAEAAHEQKLCADGKSRNLWSSAHLMVQRFEDSRVTLKLRFRVFVQENSGVPRLWKLGRKKREAAKPVAA